MVCSHVALKWSKVRLTKTLTLTVNKTGNVDHKILVNVLADATPFGRQLQGCVPEMPQIPFAFECNKLIGNSVDFAERWIFTIFIMSTTKLAFGRFVEINRIVIQWYT